MRLELKGDWYIERLTRDEIHGHRIKKRLAAVRTKYQNAEVVDTHDYGRCLFLDGLVQSTAADEFIYHESLIHPALLLHPRPENVFLAGGGEGAPLREALKHPPVKRLTMVEIDRDVVALARRHLRAWHKGAFRDKRVEIHFQDARSSLASNPESYDIIVLDLCDPGEPGPARKLFTVEFYRLLRRRLRRGGIVVLQAGSANVNMLSGFSAVFQSLRRVFPSVLPYLSCVPAYVGPWAFILAGGSSLAAVPGRKLLSRRFSARGLEGRLRFYSPEIHSSLFVLPAYIRRALERGRPASDRKILRSNR
ncbi:MAG: fused MFS/spermidine synthase [Candidatus Aminicenantes bacterium]|nr:fused MFS/spermidine synthase [Candidatus Aminicenantes bacterium]